MPGAVGATWQRSVKTAVGTLTVKRWSSGEQALRWVAAGLERASRGWRKLRGHRSMPILLAGLKRHVMSIDQEVSADRLAA